MLFTACFASPRYQSASNLTFPSRTTIPMLAPEAPELPREVQLLQRVLGPSQRRIPRLPQQSRVPAPHISVSIYDDPRYTSTHKVIAASGESLHDGHIITPNARLTFLLAQP